MTPTSPVLRALPQERWTPVRWGAIEITLTHFSPRDERISTGRINTDWLGERSDPDPLLDTCGQLAGVEAVQVDLLRNAAALHAYLMLQAGFIVPDRWLA